MQDPRINASYKEKGKEESKDEIKKKKIVVRPTLIPVVFMFKIVAWFSCSVTELRQILG